MTDLTVPINLVEELWNSSIYGIPEGHLCEVYSGWCAVIVQEGNILYVLPPNTYLLTRDTFPLLPYLMPQPGMPPMLRGTIYLIRTEDVTLFWEQPMVSKAHWTHGASLENIRGRYSVRILNPPQFITAVYRRLYEAAVESGKTGLYQGLFQSSQPTMDPTLAAASQLSAEANRFAAPLLAKAISAMEIKLRYGKRTLTQDLETVQNEIGTIIAPHLNAGGVQLQLLTIDGVSERASVPCEACGSDALPTGKVVFSSNISLFVVRFMRSNSGCFCTLCALKYFFQHTTITVFAGWWGVIGAILSPILIGSNCVNMGKSLLRFRKPSPNPVPDSDIPRLR